MIFIAPIVRGRLWKAQDGALYFRWSTTRFRYPKWTPVSKIGFGIYVRRGQDFVLDDLGFERVGW